LTSPGHRLQGGCHARGLYGGFVVAGQRPQGGSRKGRLSIAFTNRTSCPEYTPRVRVRRGGSRQYPACAAVPPSLPPSFPPSASLPPSAHASCPCSQLCNCIAVIPGLPYRTSATLSQTCWEITWPNLVEILTFSRMFGVLMLESPETAGPARALRWRV